MTTTSDQRLGTVFAGYQLEAVVGRGGMGVVYRAVRVADGRTVALKLMLPEVAMNQEFRQRFVREAQLSPVLEHDNIVETLESGESDGDLYLAMRFVEGRDLKTMIAEEGPIPLRRSLKILAQAAAALDAAHEAGVVHGDVKPQNLMVAGNGEGRERAFLTDFGLIRPIASESSASRSGAIFGSIHYMSPEQIEGIQADGRADVYALACVAYECFTGAIPFERPNEIGVIWAHIHEEPPRLRDRKPDLPGGLEDVIRQGMAKHPDDRYLTCGELVDALEDGAKRARAAVVPARLRPLVTRAKRPKTEREVWAPNFFPELSRVRKLTNRPEWAKTIAATSLLMLVAGSFVQLAHSEGLPGALADAAGAVASVSERGGDLVSSLVSDDGDESDDSRLIQQRRLPATLRPRGLLGIPRGPAAVPSRRDVVAARPRSPTNVAPLPATTLSGALRDARIVFVSTRDKQGTRTGNYSDRTELYLMDGDGSDQRRLTHTAGVVHNAYQDMAPDGRIVFTSNRSGTSLDLYVLNAYTGQLQNILTTPDKCEFGARWSPDATQVVYISGPSNGVACDFVPGRFELWKMDVRTGVKTLLSPGDVFGPGAWSPDGTQFMFERWNSSWSSSDIWVVDADGSNARPVQVTPWIEGVPDWSPDGTKIAFVRTVEGDDEIFSLELATGIERRLTDSQGADWDPAWSPDGKRILFLSRPASGDALYIMNADGSDKRILSRDPGLNHSHRWQLPYPRSVSGTISGNQFVGRIASSFDPCVVRQRVLLQTKSTTGVWSTVATTVADGAGRFVVDRPRGQARIVAPFGTTPRRDPCGLAILPLG